MRIKRDEMVSKPPQLFFSSLVDTSFLVGVNRVGDDFLKILSGLAVNDNKDSLVYVGCSDAWPETVIRTGGTRISSGKLQ